jgi:hypothetical protein
MTSARRALWLGVLACVVPCRTARAEDASAWLRDRIAVEWMAGAGAWRVSLGMDSRQPGFSTLAGGSEVSLGLELNAAVGIVASGRVLAVGFGKDHYLEGLASFGPSVRVNERVRLRAGAAAGQVILGDDRATLVGGFLVGSFDLVALGGGRLALALDLRLDIDAHVGASGGLPGQSLALALGLGLRY